MAGPGRWAAPALLVALSAAAPAPARARAPGGWLLLDTVLTERCAAAGQIQALVTAVELPGTLSRAADQAYRLVLDGKTLQAPPVAGAAADPAARPLALALVIQASAAYAADLPAIGAGVRALLRALPAGAQVRVLAYAADVRPVTAWVGPRQAMAAVKALRARDADGEPALAEALGQALQEVGPRARGGRRMVLVISDGVNRSPRRDLFRSLGDQAAAAGAPIHAVAFSPIDERGPLLNLGEIAKRSRGVLRWSRTPQGVGGQLHHLSQQILGQRALTFRVPDRCARAHRVRVRRGKLVRQELALARVAAAPRGAPARGGVPWTQLALALLALGVFTAAAVGLALRQRGR